MRLQPLETTEVKKSCWREGDCGGRWKLGAWKELMKGEKVGWKKREKHGHKQCLGARAAFLLSAVNEEQEGIRVGLQDGEGPELQNGEPKGSDFVNSIMCESITGNTEQARQDKK